MNVKEYRAYDNREKNLIYDRELWLPKSLKKLGHTAYPVHITEEGIHYTLNCLSNHYEDDWEEGVLTRYGIEIMPFTNLWDHGATRRKMYCNDIITFTLKENMDIGSSLRTGRITFCQESSEWIVVDKNDQYINQLSHVECPRVIGNWFDHAELLG